jgi:DNA modification methylase
MRESMKDLRDLKSIKSVIFGNNVELLPGVNDIFELELAYYEYSLLSHDSLLDRTAYIKSVDGKYSKHYLLYNKIELPGLDTLKNDDSNYSSAYATHGLFPYRGKFHPQLIKSFINIVGIRKGDIVLDPMAGSGTTNIECALMGIDSYAIDVSPFCRFMIKTKYEALTIELPLIENLNTKKTELFEFFNKGDVINKIGCINSIEKRKVYNLAFLAFLDAMGYAKRVKKSDHEMLFAKVLDKYYRVVKTALNNEYYVKDVLGKLSIFDDSDAIKMNIPDSSVDCVITSPPYSFAIDYAENDNDQLSFLGYDVNELRGRLIGLKGKSKEEKLSTYFADMNKVCSEVSRVLKPNKYFIMIIGSNTNQTGGIRLEQSMIDSANMYKMKLVKNFLKPIRGMRNTMKDEYVLIFQKGD